VLKEGKVDPITDNNKIFRLASANEHDGVVKFLLADGRADPTAENNDSIIMAAENGHESVVTILLHDSRSWVQSKTETWPFDTPAKMGTAKC
jgi:hypothetical protein